MRILVVIFLLLALATFALGHPCPVRTDDVPTFLTDLTLFAACLYLLQTLFRLPFVVVIVIRRTRHAHHTYGMRWSESFSDGLLRGLLDRRRWGTGQLALLDRLALMTNVLLTTVPGFGRALVALGGLLGIILLLVIYLYTGTFAFLVGEPASERGGRGLPFIDLE